MLQCSFELSEYTANVDGVGTLRLLDAVRTCELDKTVKFYQVPRAINFLLTFLPCENIDEIFTD